MKRTSQFPTDLARHVAAWLLRERGESPSLTVLVRLFETLYFTSLKTEEGHPLVCTINVFDSRVAAKPTANVAADHWSEIRFESPISLDVRGLTKLARAADPTFMSIAVSFDRRGELTIRGLIDQELRYSDFVSLDAAVAPPQPGLFQVKITGVGNISVYCDYALVGTLEQNSLVEEYHDVLWNGPVHELLKRHFHSYLAQQPAWPQWLDAAAAYDPRRTGLLVRWLNSICRVLMNIQQYKHGGGLIVSAADSYGGLNVKHRVRYDRLPAALLGLDQGEFWRGQVADVIEQQCVDPSRDAISCALHDAQRLHRQQFDEHRSEVLGCTHFIASLSRVDGFVLLNPFLQVRGFGVEVRSGEPIENIALAGDSAGSAARLRGVDMEQFGTRHRAMMRYCYENPGSLGFVVSQDGDIRALLRVDERLILWENIEVQLAFRTSNGMLVRHDRQKLGNTA